MNSDYTLKVDQFLTDTRVGVCCAVSCKYFNGYDQSCLLKQIAVDAKGTCMSFHDAVDREVTN